MHKRLEFLYLAAYAYYNLKQKEPLRKEKIDRKKIKHLKREDTKNRKNKNIHNTCIFCISSHLRGSALFLYNAIQIILFQSALG
jgi:hypothetical protein